MKLDMLFISAAVLFCLTAQIFPLTNIASADGCGINPLGDTSGDTDFYVSKNQNLPTSGGLSPAPAASGEGKAAVSLGSSAKQTRESVTVESLNPDKSSPQAAGSAIVWIANATNPDNEQMLYNFFLKGPATNGELIEKTGWIAENSWTWNTSDADIGENMVEVRVKRLNAGETEGTKTQNFTISAAKSGEQVKDAASSTEKSKSSEVNPHPGGKTADTEAAEASTTSKSSAASAGINPYPGGKTAGSDIGKPRLAPDEKKSVAATGGLSGEAISTQDTSISSDIMDVGGKWIFDLIGSGYTLDVTLIQTGESIAGIGDLIESNKKIPQTIKGKVTASTLRLQSQAVLDEYVNDVDKSVSLDLAEVDRNIVGSYEIYSGDDLIGRGNATASRFSR